MLPLDYVTMSPVLFISVTKATQDRAAKPRPMPMNFAIAPVDPPLPFERSQLNVRYRH
jgi:hypothetical protein